LVEDPMFHAPFLGVLLNRLGAVRACPENAMRLLEDKRPLIVFPEGMQGLQKPFRERYQLKRFGRGGFVKIARRARVPIIPIAIVGAEETYPLLARLPGKALGFPFLPLTPLGLIPLPAKWVIRIGAPIHVEGTDPDNLAEVLQVTERTRDTIEQMLKASLQERPSAFLGN
jgi:1-acyl-sn-glycerol-3-phosphate acyltransferase